MSGMSNCSGMSKTNPNSMQSVSSTLSKPTERADVQALNQECKTKHRLIHHGWALLLM
jgi:hypothetical protein